MTGTRSKITRFRALALKSLLLAASINFVACSMNQGGSPNAGLPSATPSNPLDGGSSVSDNQPLANSSARTPLTSSQLSCLSSDQSGCTVSQNQVYATGSEILTGLQNCLNKALTLQPTTSDSATNIASSIEAQRIIIRCARWANGQAMQLTNTSASQSDFAATDYALYQVINNIAK